MFKEEYRNQAYDYICETVALNSSREEVAAIINAIAVATRVGEEDIIEQLAIKSSFHSSQTVIPLPPYFSYAWLFGL